MFERETRREKNLETQGKEARAFSMLHTDVSQAGHHSKMSDTDLQTQLSQVEREFNEIVSLNQPNGNNS